MKLMTIRTPDELYKQIAAAAESDHRSIQGQVIWLLEQALDQQGEPR